MVEFSSLSIDPRTGFCSSNSTFYNKRTPFSLPSNRSLDIITFLSSYPHHSKTAFVEPTFGRQISFSRSLRVVDSVSTCLSGLNIRRDDVVLIIAPNFIFFPIVCLSVMHLGAVITTGQLVPKLAGLGIPVVLFDNEPVTIEVAGQVKILTTPEETHICTVPMFHIYGFGAFAIGKLANGTKVVILSKFDMNEMLSTVKKMGAQFSDDFERNWFRHYLVLLLRTETNAKC
ncbi:hypothetical protein F3Y22_tig00111272pilonHSYRG00067 [Hibiscus syriacus]|uniref:AMP-dependent synthetase/ligase domain-containing protein n=1 Tax=Hibiscus syriacus TaxID=106335 RepID=A0A6A2YSJ3_HIBSY|nr:hypothetical protein F3Y22_tig00111272pilonHSYRG00067 [Hibiscus syriacus]